MPSKKLRDSTKSRTNKEIISQKDIISHNDMNQTENDEEIELNELEKLRGMIEEMAPERGYQGKAEDFQNFSDMPICNKTLQGLSKANLLKPTDIQAASIMHSLAKRDVLGTSRTGSGKTLAFVIPVLERLFHESWDIGDGLAAIVISPTRELAYQIFQVLRIVGKYHQYSAGLITGGKKEFEGEQERITRMNILVATPGRLLQHFEQTPGFDASQLQILVLDEADRILDLGFRNQLDSILEYLPPRQTLLFSATQTKSVKDLARLSLNDAVFLHVDSDEKLSTPKNLIQNYIICNLQDKLDILFSFIKSHLKSKMIVFFSTCSQVRYVFECFRGMQPGIVLTALHGKISQDRRTSIYMEFVKRKAVCMFATDIAARGLDFPDVDWVIQVDAPEDSAMYIHRVGRTARYQSGGRSLLFLMAAEEKQVLSSLHEQNIPITKLNINTKFKISVASKAAALLASRPECKLLAKKAFTGYLRSLQLIPARNISISSLPVNEYSISLGLPFTPSVPLEENSDEGRETLRTKKNINRSLDKLKKQIKEAKEAKKREREGLNTIPSIETINSDEDEEFFEVKQTINDTIDDSKLEEEIYDPNNHLLSRKQKAIAKAKKSLKIRSDGEAKAMKLAGSQKILYDEEGNAIEQFKFQDDEVPNDVLGSSSKYVDRVKGKIDKTRHEDEKRDKERIKAMHKEQRLKQKGPKNEDVGVTLASFDGIDANFDKSEGDSDSDKVDDIPHMKRKKSKIDVDDIRNHEDLILKMIG